MKTLQNLIKSRTVWLSLLTVVLGALQSAQMLDLSPVILGYITTAIGIVAFLLRLVTSKPVINTFQG